MYNRSADFFLQGRPDDPPHYHAYDRSVECFRQAAALFTVPVQPVEIPYENTTLPGYFYPAADSAVPRPLVIIHTGYDGTAEEMHFQGAAAGAERGYNVLAFDGPGQGSLIRNQGMLFRPDWENVVGPVIDFALTLPGIDPERIVLWGVSMGGVLAPRAAAFEHRLAALVAVDGVYDMGLNVRSYAGEVPDLERRLRADDDPEVDAQFAKGIAANPAMRWATRQGQWVFGAPTPRKASAIQLDYNLRDGIAEKIACPALICDAANDLYFQDQAKLLFDHLTCPKTFLEYTAEEGADAHCQVGAARLLMGRVYNWLDDTLASHTAAAAPTMRTARSPVPTGAAP
jgi:alpha-beta hydrolase superfamily lysophospholipase